ncbi:[protein-PII] uridylyltransferase [Streptomyces sp. NPDC005438]|uniref:[protein-PII] uridylyltransferase n=1 Tax=Streptomyces sp. NPDC005438 TaxID=3156880 RepID=UPI0033A73046
MHTASPQKTGTDPAGYAAARLRLLQETARPGSWRRAELARLTDEWLAGLFDAAVRTDSRRPGPATRRKPSRRISLVALGGYGLGSLSPRSDLDLLLLHEDAVDSEQLAALAHQLWYPVWDLGIALDHSVRTPAQVRATAAEDVKVQLGLLDARHLAGDADLTAELRGGVLAQWRNRAPRQLPRIHASQRERLRLHGELQYLLEPDLKEAGGGLRDVTVLRAVAASWVADAPHRGLAEARDTLLDVRDALHLTTGRATDRLTMEDQDQVASFLGLLDADTLLRQVYEAARTVAYASDVTWREVHRVLRDRAAPRRRLGRSRVLTRGGVSAPSERMPLAEGVVEYDGEVALARTARPERDPVLPLRAAAAAARSGLPLALPSVRRMSEATVTLPEPWPSEAREAFVTLLGAGAATAPAWEALEVGGIISRLLPDWERVRCRPQRNPVHRFTVDRHLVETAVQASAFTRDVHRPDLLLVAALLHDIGKGWPGDHAIVGETIVRDMAARMGFDEADVDTLAVLVRRHLLLIDTATRRDLDDPQTIRSVAALIPDAGTLELLHALTEADARATGPAAWSDWRSTLVGELVTRTRSVLAGESAERQVASGELDAEARELALRAATRSKPELVLRLPGEADLPQGGDDAATAPQPVGAELLIALPSHPEAFAAASGVLALHRLAVRTADLKELWVSAASARADGADAAEAVVSERPAPRAGRREEGTAVLLLSWRVAAEFGALPQGERLRADLVRAVEGTLNIQRRLAEREAAYRRPRRRRSVVAPPRVTVAPHGSRSASVLEVRAQDAPGLLFRIAAALAEAGVLVRGARVSTLGDNAVDAFYVTDRETEPPGPPVPLAESEASRLARSLERTLAAD